MRKTAMLGCVLLVLAAAEAGPADQPGLSFEETVQLVEVPVYVMGPDGTPITDLNSADFSIKDNGKAQQIAFFELIDYGAAQAEQTVQFPRQFFFLFDMVLSSASGLIKARESAASFVEHQLGPRDLAAVGVLTASEGFKLLANFTGDRPTVLEALRTLGVIQSSGQIKGPQGFPFLSGESLVAVNDSGGKGAGEAAEAMERATKYAQLSDMRRYRGYASTMVFSLDGLATAMRSVSGSKQLILFSEGIHDRALTGKSLDDLAIDAERQMSADTTGLSMIDTDSSYGDIALRDNLDSAIRRLAGNDVHVHAIDIAGLRLADTSGSEFGSGRRASSSLAVLAAETGGQLFEGSNDLSGGLEQIQSRTRAVYLLAYYPTDIGLEGKYHKLEVRVERPKTNWVARPGYFEDKPYAQYTPLERQFQLADAIIKDSVYNQDFSVRAFAAPFPSAGGAVRVPVVAEIPLDRFQPDPNGQLHLEAYAFLIGPEGRFLDYLERRLTLPRSELQANRLGAVKLLEQFVAQKLTGGGEVRVVARDAIGGAVGSRTIAIAVPDFTRGPLILSTPLFETTHKSALPVWQLAELGLGSSVGDAGAELPALLRGGPANPEPDPQLAPGEVAEVSFRVFNLELDAATGQPQITMAFWCRDASNRIVKITEIRQAQPPTPVGSGTFDLTLSFRLPPLEPGEWDFVVQFTDTLANQVSTASAPIRAERRS